MPTTYTEADFDELSWHDCSIWGLALQSGGGDPAFEPADLVLDIDFIVEWVGATGAPARFRVAPAALVFHHVTDLRIEVGTTHSGDYRLAVSPWPILRIERQPIARPEEYPGLRSYAWTLALGTPTPGEVHFGASGFTQELRAEPVLTEQQHLMFAERERRPIERGSRCRPRPCSADSMSPVCSSAWAKCSGSPSSRRPRGRRVGSADARTALVLGRRTTLDRCPPSAGVQRFTIGLRYIIIRGMIRRAKPLPSASLHIVLALLDGELHGYALIGRVAELSDGVVRMGAGTLYGTLNRLVEDGLIEETTGRVRRDDSERRRYYTLTADGRAVAIAELVRLQSMVHRIAAHLPGGAIA